MRPGPAGPRRQPRVSNPVGQAVPRPRHGRRRARRGQTRQYADGLHLFAAALDTDPSNTYVYVHRHARAGPRATGDRVGALLVSWLSESAERPPCA